MVIYFFLWINTPDLVDYHKSSNLDISTTFEETVGKAWFRTYMIYYILIKYISLTHILCLYMRRNPTWEEKVNLACQGGDLNSMSTYLEDMLSGCYLGIPESAKYWSVPRNPR